MDLTSALPAQVAEALERGSTILTANQRAARTLRHAYDLRQRTVGICYWEPPAILAWDAWLGSLWHRLLLDGHASDLLLSSTQERTIWRAIIAADSTTASLRPVDSLAETAANAWKLLHAYRGRHILRTHPGNADTNAFARWVGEFERRCNQSRFLTQAQLPEFLRAAISTGRITLQSDLLLVGFDSKIPAQIALLDAPRGTGLSVERLDELMPVTNLALAASPDERAELTACARWLRNRLADRPAARIAVIVPAIDVARAEIDRVFRQVLAPELNDIATSATGPYEFSLGIPLAQTPLVAAALDILRWAIGPLPLERICALMLSPHFAANSSDTSSELLARAEFDAFFLRDQHLLQPEMSLDSLFRLASEPTHRTGLPILLKHLATLRSLFATQRNIAGTGRTHSDWAAAIHEILDAAGWAVPGHLDSVEFQTRRKWESALDELATLDFDGTRVTFADAIAALARIASETLFAPESRHAPVQIMGPLESAGSNFDAVWFLRASDLAWPSRPATNPLLPWFMQRELDMPGANPAHDAAHARRLTERIAASAPTVVFSYALESANGRQRQSSALAELQLRLCIAYDLAPEVPSDAPIELDSAIDDAPIPPPPDRILQGGAGILKSQAQCGFRALAEKRLFASALKPASLGLNPQERGSLVHTVLESFWAEVKSQAALKLMTRAEREAQLNRSIEAAFARDYSREVSGWPLAYLAAERQRLINLLHPWLEYEASKRKTFTVQSREETSKDVQIGPLRLNIRVDRIDRVDLVQSEGDDQASTGEVILDYKTGPATPADWLGSRPNEPQLPLYAVVSKMPHLAGVAFANVRAGSDAGICGYQAQDGLLPKPAKLKTESLQDQVDDWRQLLESLADGFYSGEASVSPKSYPRTCALCQQRLLCRLDLATLDPEALDDFDTDIASIDFPSGEADIV